jgi:hypothetical protein
MTRVVVAWYDSRENALRLAEPLPGVSDHQKVRVSVDTDEAPHRWTPAGDPLARLESLEAPTGDIDEIVSEIEAGRR